MRTISWISLLYVCSSVALHAQDAGERKPAPPAPAHNTMLLTGCLVAGSDEATFKLTNAIPNPQASAAQPQAVGTAGERAEYELTAEKNLDTTERRAGRAEDASSGVRSKSPRGRATNHPRAAPTKVGGADGRSRSEQAGGEEDAAVDRHRRQASAGDLSR